MSLTVSELRKKLTGIPGNTPIYLRDHDHGRYEVNSAASIVELLDQSEADPWDDVPEIIPGKYLIISS